MAPKIKIEPDQDDRQLFALISALLETCKGQEFDGYTAARYFSDTFGIYASHHLFTQTLDVMTRGDHPRAKCTQGWGTTRYKIL